MKKILAVFLLLLFILAHLTLKSQQNFIVKEDALWSTLEIHCLPQGNSYSSYFLKFEGDTVANGIPYNKIYVSEDENQSYWELFGLAREDDEHRIYFKPLDYFEGMVYDFDCSAGDTIETVNYFLNSDSMSYTVMAVDYIFLDDNMPRKQITLIEQSSQNEEIWIEGVGSYSGMLYSGNNASGGVCGSFSALCYEENSLTVYDNLSYPFCFMTGIVGETESSENSFSFYPNPVEDIINFTTDKPGVYRFELLNSLGNTIIISTFEGNYGKINGSLLSSGFYYVRITNLSSNQVITTKIIKN